MKTQGLILVGAIAMAFALASPAHSQMARSGLSGVVTDPAGLALPGVSVTVTNNATGAVRTGTTATTGRYVFNGLLPGNYSVSFEMPSFRTVRRDVVELTVGVIGELNVKMELGGVTETVTVTAETPLIQTTSKEVGGAVQTEDFTSLPTQNRSFVMFAALVPGVVPAPDSQSTASDSLYINGQDDNNNSFNVDGANNDDDVIGARAGAQTRTAIEAIQEFQILTTQFDAEFGRTQGGVLNAITKSGTNEFHGVGFYYLQDSGMNAKNFFTERNDQDQPDFKVQSIGGVVGGPVVKDRVHFFVSYERITPEEGIARSFVTRPELDFVTAEDNLLRNWLLKGDFQISNNHKVAVRYLQEYSPQFNQIIGSRTTLEASREEDDTDTSVIGSLDSVFGDRGFNNLRVSFTEEDVAFANPGFNNGGQDFKTQRGLSVSLDRPTVLEGNSTTASARLNQSFQIDDTFSLFVPDWGGDHNMRFGINYSNRLQERNDSSTANGQFDFDTDRPWNSNDRSTYPVFFTIKVGGAQGQLVGIPANDVYGLFFQDDWQVNDNLTLNLGLRWDKEEITKGSTYFGPRIGFSLDPNGEGRTAIRGGYGRFYERLQLGDTNAWDDFFLDAIELPGGFNIRVPDSGSNQQLFFDLVQQNGLTSLNQLRDLLASQLETGSLLLLNTQPQVDNPDRRQPYADTFSIGAEHELTPGLAIGGDFVHTRNRDIRVVVDLNPFSRALGGRPNLSILRGERLTSMGSIQSSVNAGQTDYTGLQFSIRKRYRDTAVGPLSFRLSYTRAFQSGNARAGVESNRFQTRTESGYNFDTGEFLGEPLQLNLDDPRNRDRASSWIRDHNFVTSWSWLVPGTSWQSSSGLHISGIWRWMSGDKFTIQSRSRMDNNNRDVGAAGSYTANTSSDIAQAIEFDGSINGADYPDFMRLDLTLRYAIPVGDYEIMFLGDFFNLTNRVNFDEVGSDFLEDRGFLIPTAAFSPREFQFGIRFTF